MPYGKEHMYLLDCDWTVSEDHVYEDPESQAQEASTADIGLKICAENVR